MQVYREVTGRSPTRPQRDLIARTVGESPAALQRWREVVQLFVGRGWNYHAVDNLLDRFQKGGNLNERPDTHRPGADGDARPGEPVATEAEADIPYYLHPDYDPVAEFVQRREQRKRERAEFEQRYGYALP